VDLTFAPVPPRILQANVKSKSALKAYTCWCPFGSDIRKRTRRNDLRMSEPGHQCGGFDIRSGGTANPPSECQIQTAFSFRTHFRPFFYGDFDDTILSG
jgi:hypothetical protein